MRPGVGAASPHNALLWAFGLAQRGPLTHPVFLPSCLCFTSWLDVF